MSGIFPSTGIATFMVRYPIKTSTTGGSAPLSYASSYGIANSGFTCVISRPTGADIIFTMNSPPSGITWDFVGSAPGASFRINVSSAHFTSAGMYHCCLKVTADAAYLAEIGTLQWGGWVDGVSTGAADAATAAAQATLAAGDAATARKMLTNRIAANSATAPTSVTVYDDDDTTPLGTRTIANADASSIPPGQILNLGKVVP